MIFKFKKNSYVQEMIKQKWKEAEETVRETLERLAEKDGVYVRYIRQPSLGAKDLLDDVINKWEAEDTTALDALQEKIEKETGVSDMSSFSFFIEEEVSEAQSMFSIFGHAKNKTLIATMDTEVATLDLNVAAILPTTNAKLKELIEAEGAAGILLGDPNLAVVIPIIGNIFTAETKEKVKLSIIETGQGFTFGDIVRIRGNYMKQIDIELRNNRMLPDGALELKKVFFGTLSEDLYNNLNKIIAEGKITPEQAQHFRQTDEAYKAK